MQGDAYQVFSLIYLVPQQMRNVSSRVAPYFGKVGGAGHGPRQARYRFSFPCVAWAQEMLAN